jgi:hypothetical protein
VQISHGIAVLAAVTGWDASCRKFKQCWILTRAERERMSAVARPAWKQWVTKDFGIDVKLVDQLWDEVARLEKETGPQDVRRYGQ